MKFSLSALIFSLGVSGAALGPRQSGCCFQINVRGGPGTGPLGQLSDGQNRVGPGYTAATYCLNNGIITDSSGRGCILTPPTTQFQCDMGATGNSTFSVACGGAIAFNGNTQFYECLVSPGVYNIYTSPGGTQCSAITLSTVNGACGVCSSAPPVSPTPTPTPTPAPSPSTATVVTTATVTGPTVTTTATVTGPCSPTTATVAGPTVTAIATTTLPGSVTTVAGPTVTVPAYTTKTITAPGTTITATVAGPTVTATATVTGPGTTQTVAGPTVTATKTVAGPTITQTSVQTVTGPGATVTQTVAGPTVSITGACYPSTVTSSVTITAAGPTTTVTAPGGTVTVAGQNVTSTATVAGAIQTVYVTKTAPGGTVTSTVTAPCYASTVTVSSVQTITAQGPGSTVTVQGPGSTVTVQGPGSTITVTAPGAGPSTVTSVVTNTVTKTVSASSGPSASTCSTNVPNTNFQYPHLIVPVSSASPNTAYGTSYFGTVNDTISTIFNFDIPASYQGTTCTLIFLLPAANTLQTSSYTLTGSGSIDVLQLSGPASTSTTYNNQPSVAKDLGTFAVTAGSSSIITTGACAAGQTIAYELKATGSLALSYFQDYNAPAIGLYITEC